MSTLNSNNHKIRVCIITGTYWGICETIYDQWTRFLPISSLSPSSPLGSGYFYLRSLPLNGTTWIPRGPPSFDTSTSLTMSLGDGDGWMGDEEARVDRWGGGSGEERRGVTPCGRGDKTRNEITAKETTWWQEQNGANKQNMRTKKVLKETDKKKNKGNKRVQFKQTKHKKNKEYWRFSHTI